MTPSQVRRLPSLAKCKLFRRGLAATSGFSPFQRLVPQFLQSIQIGLDRGCTHGISHERIADGVFIRFRGAGLAEPNMVVIAEATRRLIGNLFELKDLGLQDLKGIAGSVQVWAALRPAAVAGHFEAFHGSDLSTIVGREEETQLLLRRWSRAKDGEGQVVLLSGEAGIGKSRLTTAFLKQISEEPHARLRCFCSPQHTDSALYPIIGQLERAAEFKHDDSVKTKLDKFDSLLARSPASPGDPALLADLLSLPNDGRYLPLTYDPQERRKRTLEALVGQVEALSRSEPMLMIFEDAHWIDPTSLELVGRILERIVASAGPADRHVPAGISAALGWPSTCDSFDHQSAWSPRRGCHH